MAQRTFLDFKSTVYWLCTFIIVMLLISDVYCAKNCSYKTGSDSRIVKYKICYDELICCENALSEHEICCNPPEYQPWNSVLPVKLTIKNLAFIVVLFIGIILVGGLFIGICMLISKFIENQKEIKPVHIVYEPVIARNTDKFPIYYCNRHIVR